jgi:hypothetical protein
MTLTLYLIRLHSLPLSWAVQQVSTVPTCTHLDRKEGMVFKNSNCFLSLHYCIFGGNKEEWRIPYWPSNGEVTLILLQPVVIGWASQMPKPAPHWLTFPTPKSTLKLHNLVPVSFGCSPMEDDFNIILSSSTYCPRNSYSPFWLCFQFRV